jgi:hypothetical protein
VRTLRLTMQDELEQMLRHSDITNRRIPILCFANKASYVACVRGVAGGRGDG